jgi:hypothetical protein
MLTLWIIIKLFMLFQTRLPIALKKPAHKVREQSNATQIYHLLMSKIDAVLSNPQTWKIAMLILTILYLHSEPSVRYKNFSSSNNLQQGLDTASWQPANDALHTSFEDMSSTIAFDSASNGTKSSMQIVMHRFDVPRINPKASAADYFEPTISHLRSQTVCADEAEEMQITLTTQTGIERVNSILAICQSWQFNMIAAIYVPPNKLKFLAKGGEFERLAVNLNRYCPRLTVIIAQPNDVANDFPTNALRNILFGYIRTSHFFYVDVDLLPSQNLHNELIEAWKHSLEDRGANQDTNTPFVLVVPAFWLAPQCMKESDCQQNVAVPTAISSQPLAPKYPFSIDRLGICIVTGYCEPFLLAVNFFSHTTTRNARLFDSSANPSIPLSCAISRSYEPFLVARTCEVPKFVAHFSGYGRNKIQWIQHLIAMGFKFRQLTSGFVLHMPHPPSESMQTFDDKKRNVVRHMFSRFVEWLDKTYPPGKVAQNFPFCLGKHDVGETPSTEQRLYASKDLDEMVSSILSRNPVSMPMHKWSQVCNPNKSKSAGRKNLPLETCKQRCVGDKQCRYVVYDYVSGNCEFFKSCELTESATPMKLFAKLD